MTDLDLQQAQAMLADPEYRLARDANLEEHAHRLIDAQGSVHTRWAAVQRHLPAIGKDAHNNQQGFDFRSIDAVLAHVHELFGEHGIFVVPERQVPEYTERQTQRGGSMHVVNLTVDWRIYGASGDSFTAQTIGEGTDLGDKATSKAQTMAFKYLLWPTLSVAGATEDPDGETQPESRSSSRGRSRRTTEGASGSASQSGPETPAAPANTRTIRKPPGQSDGPPPADANGELMCDTQQKNEIVRLAAAANRFSDRDVLAHVATALPEDRRDVAALADLTHAEAAEVIATFSGEKL